MTTLAATETISAHQLRTFLAHGPTLRLLDVRTGGEFETAYIPGSHNVPLATLDEHAGDLAAVDHPVVLICQSGARANQARAKLAAAGKDAVHILEGGMNAWQAAGCDVAHGDNERWALDRQVRFVAGTIALTGIAASVIVPRAKWIAGGVAGGLTFSAVTNTCAMAAVLGKLPYNRTPKCDIDGVLDALNRKAA